VGNFEDHQRIISTVGNYYKEHLDIVVCSAGTYNPLYSLDDDKYDCEHIEHLINVNLKGTIFAVKTSLPLLKKSSAGRIIIISSITGPYTSFDNSSLYGATKSGQVYTFRDQLFPCKIRFMFFGSQYGFHGLIVTHRILKLYFLKYIYHIETILSMTVVVFRPQQYVNNGNGQLTSRNCFVSERFWSFLQN